MSGVLAQGEKQRMGGELREVDLRRVRGKRARLVVDNVEVRDWEKRKLVGDQDELLMHGSPLASSMLVFTRAAADIPRHFFPDSATSSDCSYEVLPTTETRCLELKVRDGRKTCDARILMHLKRRNE